MNLQETIKQLIHEQGKDVVRSSTFMGMLDDYGAFREEEPATKTIVRELVKTGQVQRLADSLDKRTNLHFEVRTIVAETARSGGFREELVFVTLRKIAIGVGKIKKEQDWPSFNEEKVEGEKSSRSSIKVAPKQVTATGTPAKSSARPSVWKRIGKWFAGNYEELLFGAFIICVLLAIITLIQTIYRLVVGPPDVAEAKAWEFLICLICTGVMWFVNE
ncbi:MAG: hypothetical protein IKV05_01105 [Bacteroidales bacterium]|nr:hypothetical protein [Bacteroidales bacterium]